MSNSLIHANIDYTQIVLPELPVVPGMISTYEAKYLYWLTSQYYTGRGAVVELGTRLGKSSIHLGAGLRDSEHPSTLHCYDLFFWHRNFNAPHLVKQTGLELEHGADFQPYFEKNVRPVYDNLSVVKGPSENIVWDGREIEILFVDAPKSQKSICAVLETFGEYLIPGVSTIVMQDFLHSPSYPLALVFSELSDELEFAHAVPHSSTAVFSVQRAVSVRRDDPRFKIEHWTESKLQQAWGKVLPALPQQSRDFLSPGVAMSLLDNGKVSLACSAIQKLQLSAEGDERLSFLRDLPQYYARYQPIFDSYFDQSISWEKETIGQNSSQFRTINGASVIQQNSNIAIRAEEGGVAALVLDHPYRNQVEIEVEVLFSTRTDTANGFIVFGDQTDLKHRICVGVYMGKSELWIEEHSAGRRFELENIRRHFDFSETQSVSMTILVNLDSRTIRLICAGHTIQTSYAKHLREIRWVGYRIYNTETNFGLMSIGSPSQGLSDKNH